MIEMQAVLTCERCNRSIVMFNCDTVQEAWARATEADWCEEEDAGEEVCPECWAEWDAAQRKTADAVAAASE